MSAIISVRDLEKTFGQVYAARDITLDIDSEQVTGIIGANGAGKTSFVNMITGHLTPSRGTIAFEGRVVSGLPSRTIARLGIARSFQVAQIFPSLTVEENVLTATAISNTPPNVVRQMLAPRESRATRDTAEEIIARFRLGDHRHAPARQLSQGVRKILDIAMAVVSRPRVILLDEPTSGISIEEKYDLMDVVIAALKASGITILFVEHDMEIVARFADRVLAFHDGTVFADGPPAKVLADPEVQKLVTGTSHAAAAAVGATGAVTEVDDDGPVLAPDRAGHGASEGDAASNA